ncbi:MAG: YfhO family protein, partial [Bifidobacteriaceae bacterium]|nr:YfhO family protein [Bifidobacteriaceae bacterium]
MHKKYLSNILLFKRFAKRDYLALFIIEIILFLFFAFLILFARHLGLVYATGSNPFQQHVAFPNNFRALFYQSHNLLPQFIPNLGGGQNAFNFIYDGLVNPLIISSYLFPFLSMYHYWVILNVAIVMISTALLYIWLRNRFASIPTIVATICFAFSNTIIFHTHQHYMFIDYFPFLILALIVIDRIDFSVPLLRNGFFSSKKFLVLVVCSFLIAQISFFYIPGCFICIGLYTIFVWLEKNPKSEKTNNKFNFKKFIFDMLKVVGSLLAGLMLAMFILLPTFLAVRQSARQGTKIYSFFDLFFPSIDTFYISTGQTMAFTLGLGGAAFIVAVALVFSKKLNVRVVSILFLTLTCIPIFSFIANGGMYKTPKSLIPLIPIAILFIAILFSYIQKPLKTVKFINYKLAISFLSVALIFAIVSPAIVNNLPSKETKYQETYIEKRLTDPGLSEKIQTTFALNSTVYRSSVINKNSSEEPPYNVIFDKNYFSSGIYSSLFSKSWSDYVHEYTWSPFTSATSVIAPTYSPFASVLLGNKHAFSLDNKPPFLVSGYKQIEPGVWQNDSVFSLGYATDKTYSDIKDFDNKQTVASLISGIDIDNSSDTFAPPNVDKLQSYDLSKLFSEISGGQTSFSLSAKTNFTYKLPEQIQDKLLFIQIDLPKSSAVNNAI